MDETARRPGPCTEEKQLWQELVTERGCLTVVGRACAGDPEDENRFSIKSPLANLALYKVKGQCREVDVLLPCKLKALAGERREDPGPVTPPSSPCSRFPCCVMMPVERGSQAVPAAVTVRYWGFPEHGAWHT